MLLKRRPDGTVKRVASMKIQVSIWDHSGFQAWNKVNCSAMLKVPSEILRFYSSFLVDGVNPKPAMAGEHVHFFILFHHVPPTEHGTVRQIPWQLNEVSLRASRCRPWTRRQSHRSGRRCRASNCGRRSSRRSGDEFGRGAER